MTTQGRETKGHTPGPWKAATLAFGGAQLAKCAVIHDFPNNTIPPNFDMSIFCIAEGLTEANARLIAAAPDLLAALEWIEEIADVNYEQDEKLRSQGARTLKRVADRARAAIAKATGRDET